MLKAADTVLLDLQALQFNAALNIQDPTGLRFYTMALVSVATQWGVQDDFLATVKKMEVLRQDDNILSLPAAR